MRNCQFIFETEGQGGEGRNRHVEGREVYVVCSPFTVDFRTLSPGSDFAICDSVQCFQIRTEFSVNLGYDDSQVRPVTEL